MTKHKLFAGFDGGGSKTACVLCGEDGELLGTGLGGPSNYLYCGREQAAASVRDALESAFRAAGIQPCTLDTAYMASASIRMLNGAAHVPFFRTCIDADNVLCESDVYPIWFGAARERPAAVSIVGTGSITYVCRPGAYTCSGGWGPLLGDEGSGYDIGLAALRKVARMSDGREEPDHMLINAILLRFGASSARDLIRAVETGDRRSSVAGAAKVVSQLAGQGCACAVELLENAAEEIARAVAAACRRDGGTEPIPLILSGGLVENGRPMFSLVAQAIPKYVGRISEVRPVSPAPSVSAAALALHNRGLDVAAERLLNLSGGEQP